MRYGFRPTVMIGMGLVLAGSLLLVVRAQAPNIAVVAVACFVIGLGLGLVASPSLIAAQASVGWSERGVVTGANMFARSIGSAVGVAVFGAVANAVFERAGGPSQPSAIIDGATAVFVAVLVATVLTTVVAALMPAVRADDPALAASSE
jgi:MFS family permease